MHWSSSITPEDHGQPVIQLKNYDEWLKGQAARHKTGFVLAIEDMAASQMPSGWVCVTWAGLGLQLKAALDAKDLPADESLLARHMLGFIRKHLWSASQMAIDFDDIALLRAFAGLGMTCAEKINQLVAQLKDVLDVSYVSGGRRGGAWTPHSDLFGKHHRSTLGRSIFDSGEYPAMYAGVDSYSMVIWLVTDPKYPRKERITQALQFASRELRERDSNWKSDLKDNYWCDLEWRMPLSVLLIEPEEKQRARFNEIFKSALEDMKQARVVEAMEEAMR